MESMAKDSNSWRNVRLPDELCTAAEERIKGTKYASLEELLTFVLGELVSQKSGQLEEQERKMIEQRLRDLGYM
jgi:hypothetical protein